DGIRDKLVTGVQTCALPICGDQVLDRLDLRLVVAVGLARERLERHARLVGGLLGTFLHLHEEGVGVGLGDQADDRLLAAAGASRSEERRVGKEWRSRWAGE